MQFKLRGGLVVLAMAFTAAALAQEPDKANEKRRAEQLARMRERAESIRVLSNPRNPDSVVKLSKDPVLRYGDNTRQNDEATLWIWSNGTRPVALMAIEYYEKSTMGPDGPHWLYEIASVSTHAIAAQDDKRLRWTGKGPGIGFTRLDDADPVADKSARRLSQMKELFRRFTAHEKEGTSGRIELRPLSSPLHRYTSSDDNVQDGAIFALCNGTNPEVLVILEAQTRGDSPAAWQYALVQMTGGIVEAELDGKQIWERGQADPPAVRDNYVNGWFDSKKKAE